jgi:hypothetical protein
LAGEGEEDVVQVGGVDRQAVDLDRGVVEPLEQGPQRLDAAVAGDLEREAWSSRTASARVRAAASSPSG